MTRKTMWGVAALVALMAIPAAGQGQVRSLQDIQVGDLESMKGKFVGLAEAFPEDSYDWRPMEGVRSVKEVLSLIVAENYVFPPMWGAEAAPGVTGGFMEQMNRATALSRSELIEALGASFDYAIAAVKGMDPASMGDEMDFFRSRVHRGTSIVMGTGDAHEHLGQLIAYARMNKIVPPWSRSSGQ